MSTSTTSVGGGLILTELKTKSSRRTLPLPAPLIDALRSRRQRQRGVQIHVDSGVGEQRTVFTTITGHPAAPRDPSVHCAALLDGAGVRYARVHDARHTAATFLLVHGVDQRVVMSMFGWTNSAMTTWYQHVVPELVEEANHRMSGRLGVQEVRA